MPRRRSRGGEAAIWPGFVDGLSSLILVLMVVLSLFVVAQFYLGEELTQKDSELARLQSRIASLADQLGLLELENAELRGQVTSLTGLLEEKEAELTALTGRLAEAESAVAASAEELEAEKALSEDQKSEIATLNAQLAALRKQLLSLQEALEAAEAKDLEQQAQIENLSTRLNAALARKVQELAEVRSFFFAEVRQILEDLDGVSIEGDRVVIAGDTIFGPCNTELSIQTRHRLNEVAEVILEIERRVVEQIVGRDDLDETQAVQDWIIRVDGHADSTPLGPSCAARFTDNKGLSTARALSVTRHLEQSGVPSKRLLATGLGSDFPLYAGDDPALQARNRRIEFKLTER
jgi:chemotaxis protein MotB